MTQFCCILLSYFFQENGESSKMYGGKKTNGTAGGSRGTHDESRYAQGSRKTADSDASATRATTTAEPSVNENEKQLKELRAQFLAKKRKFHAMKLQFLKKQVRISPSQCLFHILSILCKRA